VDLVHCLSFSPAALELHIIGFLLVSLYRLRLCSYAFLKMHVFECEYSDKTLVLDCDCYIFFYHFLLTDGSMVVSVIVLKGTLAFQILTL